MSLTNFYKHLLNPKFHRTITCIKSQRCQKVRQLKIKSIICCDFWHLFFNKKATLKFEHERAKPGFERKQLLRLRILPNLKHMKIMKKKSHTQKDFTKRDTFEFPSQPFFQFWNFTSCDLLLHLTITSRGFELIAFAWYSIAIKFDDLIQEKFCLPWFLQARQSVLPSRISQDFDFSPKFVLQKMRLSTVLTYP